MIQATQITPLLGGEGTILAINIKDISVGDLMVFWFENAIDYQDKPYEAEFYIVCSHSFVNDQWIAKGAKRYIVKLKNINSVYGDTVIDRADEESMISEKYWTHVKAKR